MGVAAVPAVPSFVYRHIFLCEGGKKERTPFQGTWKLSFVFSSYYCQTKVTLELWITWGPSLAGSKAFPREWITYSKFSADQKKCLLSCWFFFFFFPPTVLFHLQHHSGPNGICQKQLANAGGGVRGCLNGKSQSPLSMLKVHITFDLFKWFLQTWCASAFFSLITLYIWGRKKKCPSRK